MGVDPQQHRAVTGLFSSRLSSSSWSPSSRGGVRGGAARRDEGREEGREGWREEVAGQRREFTGRVLGWCVPGLLWTILLHQLYSMLPSLWQQHGRNQPFGNITNQSETNFSALFVKKHKEHFEEDVLLKAFLSVILIL